ncbi:hypothetical protein B0H13DRAFT_2430929 [Mycena leptocephala]|nr:hypothetical protein B0H13DRAFT_2430929 [Mycena leptocephala]
MFEKRHTVGWFKALYSGKYKHYTQEDEQSIVDNVRYGEGWRAKGFESPQGHRPRRYELCEDEAHSDKNIGYSSAWAHKKRRGGIKPDTIAPHDHAKRGEGACAWRKRGQTEDTIRTKRKGGGRRHLMTAEAARLTKAPAVGSARTSKEVPSCRSYVVGSWYRPGVTSATGIWGDEEETGGDPVWRPESDTGRGGDERMKRRRGDSTGFVSMTPSNDESNPATQHAGGAGTDRKEVKADMQR